MKTLSAFLIFAMTLMVAAPGFALFGQQQAVEGTITSIEENTLNLLKENGNGLQPVEVQVNAQTKFEKGETLSSLQKGDIVKVEYKEEGDDKIAITVAKVEKPGAMDSSS